MHDGLSIIRMRRQPLMDLVVCTFYDTEVFLVGVLCGIHEKSRELRRNDGVIASDYNEKLPSELSEQVKRV